MKSWRESGESSFHIRCSTYTIPNHTTTLKTICSTHHIWLSSVLMVNVNLVMSLLWLIFVLIKILFLYCFTQNAMTVVSFVYICLDRGVLLPVGESVSQIADPIYLLAFVGSQSLLILSDFSYSNASLLPNCAFGVQYLCHLWIRDVMYLAIDLSLIVSKRWSIIEMRQAQQRVTLWDVHCSCGQSAVQSIYPNCIFVSMCLFSFWHAILPLDHFLHPDVSRCITRI